MSNKIKNEVENITASEAREKLLKVWSMCEFGIKERVKKAYSHRTIQYMLATETYSDTQKILNVIETIKEQCEAVKDEAIAMEQEVIQALV